MPFKLLHEVCVHDGIRKAFGDENANALFDLVWKDRQDHPFMQRILDRYNLRKAELDENGEALLDDEGNPVYQELTQAEQREAAEEFLAHLGETNGVPMPEIYLDHRTEIDAWGRLHGYDTRDLRASEKERMIRDWMADTGFRPERPGWLKQLISSIRIWLNKHGWFVHHLSDDDILTILARSAAATRRNRFNVQRSKFNAGETRYAAALRRVGDPNNAEGHGLLRDSNVQYADGFMKWAGLKGSRLYADYEFLYGRHSRYFKDPEHARAAVELVLSKPEKVQNIKNNLSFVGFDEETGAIYRIEIDPAIKNKYNHIRSVFEITADQYNKAKLESSPVLQPSPTKENNQLADRTLSSFLRYDNAENQNVKPDSENNSKFSIIGENGANSAVDWYSRQNDELWKMMGLDLATPRGNAMKRLEYLDTAKQMADSGMDMEKIKLATGWEKGGDGKWKTETADNWVFSMAFQRLEPDDELPFGNCISNGMEFLSAYPELRNYTVRIASPVEMQNADGMFDREGEEIVLKYGDLPKMKSVLIHEIQHWIQDKEGFARGGNLQTGAGLAASGTYSSTELADAYRKFHDNVKLLPGELYENIGRVLHDDSFRNFRDVLNEDIGTIWGGEDALSLMRNAYDSSNQENFMSVYNEALERAEKGNPGALELYQRIAGEVEARNAQKRADMPIGERLQTLLANTEDVAEQDKIYLENHVAPDIRYSVSDLWTGSAADYDEPSLQYVGTGEGAQVYGWGLYAADNRSIAEWYAENDAENKRSDQIYFDGVLITDDMRDVDDWGNHPLADDSEATDVVFDVKEAYDVGLELNIFSASDAVAYVEEKLEEQIFAGKDKQWKPLSVAEKQLEYLRSVEDKFITKNGRNLYRQTFWPDKEENLLLWNEEVTEEQKAQILDELSAMESNPAVVSFVNRERDDWQIDEETGELEEEPKYYPQDVLRDYLDTYLDFYEATGEYVYKQLADLFGSPQAASEFLYRAGIDGVKYPAGSHGTGDGSKGWNYVAFSDEDIRVDEHIRYSLELDERTKNLIAMMKPLVGPYMLRDPEFYVKRMREKYGVQITEAEAKLTGSIAARENQSDARKREIGNRNEWLDHRYPLYSFIVEFTGKRDFLLKPTSHQGTDFTGSFISPQYVKWSELKPRRFADGVVHLRQFLHKYSLEGDPGQEACQCNYCQYRIILLRIDYSFPTAGNRFDLIDLHHGSIHTAGIGSGIIFSSGPFCDLPQNRFVKIPSNRLKVRIAEQIGINGICLLRPDSYRINTNVLFCCMGSGGFRCQRHRDIVASVSKQDNDCASAVFQAVGGSYQRSGDTRP